MLKRGIQGPLVCFRRHIPAQDSRFWGRPSLWGMEDHISNSILVHKRRDANNLNLLGWGERLRVFHARTSGLDSHTLPKQSPNPET